MGTDDPSAGGSAVKQAVAIARGWGGFFKNLLNLNDHLHGLDGTVRRLGSSLEEVSRARSALEKELLGYSTRLTHVEQRLGEIKQELNATRDNLIQLQCQVGAQGDTVLADVLRALECLTKKVDDLAARTDGPSK
ncbi:MAG TPA: hypothetical protein ENJ19_03170 [Gammaproteobacteria bacterium]|nr:hypothetical protein [Gammaproteobacteria bacterium]